MSEITLDNLSALFSMILGVVLFGLMLRFVWWNTGFGRWLRTSVLLTMLVMAYSYCGATKPDDRSRMAGAVRGLMRLGAPQEVVLPQSETLSLPEYLDKESFASVGFKDEFGCAMMEVSIGAQCFNSSANSFEIVFETGVEDGSKVDMMVGFEDGAWMCAAGDACTIDGGGSYIPYGTFELKVNMVLGRHGHIADCRVTANGTRIPFIEQTICAANPHSWRKVSVYSRNGDGAQPSIDVDSSSKGFIIRIR